MVSNGASSTPNGAADAAPLSDIVREAERIVTHAQESGVCVRLIGGLAIDFQTRPHALPSALQREYQDIDLVTVRKGGASVGELLETLGYAPDEQFNMLNRGSRALFYDSGHRRQLDVFIGSFSMCHTIPILDRIEVEPTTVPLAELLLTKLQIVKINRKDVHDILALVVTHEVGDSDSGTVNAAHIAHLCSNDWGLWRTCTMNIEVAEGILADSGLSSEEKQRAGERLTALRTRIDAEPKSRKWRLRSRLGDRVRWYEEPEEVD